MKHPLVEKLEKRLLPEFEEVVERIRLEIPNIKVSVYSDTVGSQTQYQGYGFWIDCLLMDIVVSTETSEELPDNIALEVGLGYLTTTTRLSASVVWGHPSGSNEAEFKEWSGIFPDEGMIVTD